MNRKALIKILSMIMVTALVLSVQVFAAEVNITGKINDMYQIVTDVGEAYELADNDLAYEVLDHVGKTVRITGTLIEDDSGVKTILVSEYQIIEQE